MVLNLVLLRRKGQRVDIEQVRIDIENGKSQKRYCQRRFWSMVS